MITTINSMLINISITSRRYVCVLKTLRIHSLCAPHSCVTFKLCSLMPSRCLLVLNVFFVSFR